MTATELYNQTRAILDRIGWPDGLKWRDAVGWVSSHGSELCGDMDYGCDGCTMPDAHARYIIEGHLREWKDAHGDTVNVDGCTANFSENLYGHYDTHLAALIAAVEWSLDHETA